MILICAATEFELAVWGPARHGERLAVTGVGIPATLMRLPEFLTPDIGHIVNIGIAGAYDGSGLLVGDVVQAESDIFGDIGFELPAPPHFQPIQDSAFGDFYATPLPCVPLPDRSLAVPRAHGCTVGMCTGTAATGQARRARFAADFETMEGAAVALVGQRAERPVTGLRAISNIAARRDMRPENIRSALDALRRTLAR
jgi:futalosine hydrolase